MKQKFVLFFILTIVLAMPKVAVAYDFSAVVPSGQTLYFNFVGGKVEVTYPSSFDTPYSGYPKPTGDLIIPSSITHLGRVYPVTCISYRAFFGCDSLTSVVISDSVTYIDERAFFLCSGLTAVTIPDATTHIAPAAFGYCSGLTSIHFGRSIQEISKFAFYNCSSLTSIIIDGHTTIREWVFKECSNLTTAILSVDTIYHGAFMNCDNLTKVTLGPSLAYIDDSTFGGCTRMDSIVCKSMTPPFVKPRGFEGMNDDVVVIVPCGAADAYENTEFWSWTQFNIQEDLMHDFSVTSSDSARGTATIISGPTCENRWAKVRADAYPGYHFDHWSDGNRISPRYIAVVRDTHLVAYFASDNGEEGIEETVVEGAKIYQSNGQIVVESAEGSRVMVYDVFGRVLATKRDDGGLLRFDAPAAGVYLVKVGDASARKVAVVR